MDNQMKRWILLAIIPIMLCLVWASRSMSSPVETLSQNIPVDKADVVTIPETTDHLPVKSTGPTPLFEIGVWQGRVAVFHPEDAKPVQTLETPVLSLPQPDQLALQERIPVYDQLQLAAYLEDYGS